MAQRYRIQPAVDPTTNGHGDSRQKDISQSGQNPNAKGRPSSYPELRKIFIQELRPSTSRTSLADNHRPRTGTSEQYHDGRHPALAPSSRGAGGSASDALTSEPPQHSYAQYTYAADSPTDYVRAPPPVPPSRRTRQVTQICPPQTLHVNGNPNSLGTPQILVEHPTPLTGNSSFASNNRTEPMPFLYSTEEPTSHLDRFRESDVHREEQTVRPRGSNWNLQDNARRELQAEYDEQARRELQDDYDEKIDEPQSLDARNTTPARPPKPERLRQIALPVRNGNPNGDHTSRPSYEAGDDAEIDVYRPDLDVVDDNANWNEESVPPRRGRVISETAETAGEIFHRIAKEPANKIETSILSPGLLFTVDTTNWAQISRRAPAEMQGASSAHDALQEAVTLHGKLGILDTSPLISLTAELVRAFANAKELARTGHVGVRIIAIDMRMMEVGSLLAANHLRYRLRLEENESSISEVLAWEGVPAKSLVFTWPWEDLLNSKLTKEYFPALVRSKPLACCIECEEKTRRGLSFRNPDVHTADLVIALIALGLQPNTVVTLHMVESFMALSRGETCLRHYKESPRWPRANDQADIERWLSIATTWISYMDLEIE